MTLIEWILEQEAQGKRVDMETDPEGNGILTVDDTPVVHFVLDDPVQDQ